MMFSVGQRLRAARLQQGLDFDAVVARTKISEKFLKAIEADDRASFPSGFFYKSFVDQYARALSVDAREIDSEVNNMLSAEAPLPLPGQDGMPIRRPEVIPPPRLKQGRIYSSIALFAVALAGGSGFYAWWGKLSIIASQQIKSKLAVHAAKQSVVPKVVPKVVNTDPPRAAAQPEPASPEPAQPQSATVPVSLAVQTDSPPEITAPDSGVRLELVAREQTWVSISTDGLMVFKGTLGARESKTISGKEFAKLRINNPAALEVRLNGKVLAPLGPPGQFRVVVFTRGKYHVLDSDKASD